MKDIIKTEFMKIKRKRLFTLLLICEIASIFIDYCIEGRSSEGQLSWVDLLYNFSGFNFMIMIIAFSIVISKVVDVEYKSDMWKLMFTAVENKTQLFIGKFICILLLLAFATGVEFFGLIILGKLLGVAGTEYSLIVKQCIFPLIGYLPVVVLQFTLSTIIKNQSISIACGVIGCFLGVFGLVMPFGPVLIWIYPFLTAPMTILQDGSTSKAIMNESNILFTFLSVIIASIMFSISLRLHNKKENF